MFIQNKSQVTMTIELLDTEEAQADDPLDVQVTPCFRYVSWRNLEISRQTATK